MGLIGHAMVQNWIDSGVIDEEEIGDDSGFRLAPSPLHLGPQPPGVPAHDRRYCGCPNCTSLREPEGPSERKSQP